MLYEQFELRGRTPAEVETEILFEVASRRVGGAELLRINIVRSDDDKLDARLMRFVTKVLKGMKARSLIQFFAFPENFETMGMESRFLINKYPGLVEAKPEILDYLSFVYIKL